MGLAFYAHAARDGIDIVEIRGSLFPVEIVPAPSQKIGHAPFGQILYQPHRHRFTFVAVLLSIILTGVVHRKPRLAGLKKLSPLAELGIVEIGIVITR